VDLLNKHESETQNTNYNGYTEDTMMEVEVREDVVAASTK